VENHLKTQALAASPDLNLVGSKYFTLTSDSQAPGRIIAGAPIAVIDIGSNSVRLVVYEGLTRSPTPIFNEKVLAGLGRNVFSSGHLPENGVRDALAALRRFRILCEIMKVKTVKVLATAAARDAENGQVFLREAHEILGGSDIELLSGDREAKLSAMGVLSGFPNADGIMGDMGGGSLELVDIRAKNNGENRLGKAISLRLGGLALQDTSGNSLKKAKSIIKDEINDITQLDDGLGRTFYAVGGTWRALAKLHMRQTSYPLSVMHGYSVSAKEMLDFCRMVQRVSTDSITGIHSIASARRPLLIYGALLLESIITKSRVKRVVLSAFGVREGLLFESIDDDEKRVDPLLFSANELNFLTSRAPKHGFDLANWCDHLMKSTNLEDGVDEKRLRLAACLLSDIAWRAHPDYRAEQSLETIAHAALAGVDHPGRTFLALSVYYRHIGSSDGDLRPSLRELASSHQLEHARILGAAMRVAYIVSAAMPEILPQTPITCEGKRVILRLPKNLAHLVSDRLNSRLKQLAKLLGREPLVMID
jgi:exopolyphosphatase / guanosine-5'-triphosphate,3'-diphosphate pyrophosphatase